MGKRRLDADDYCSVGERYAAQVVAGEVPACKWVRLACQRQINDRAREDWRWIWNPEAGNRVCKFIENLPHVKGRWKSRNLKLEPWQCFLITVLFAWVGEDGFRRYRTGYIEVPRKNAKTTLCAGIALYMLCADGEPGAEVYSAAVTRDQARISWEISQQMVKRESEMREFYGVEALAHSIVVEENAASFKPLSRDADSLEGLSPHFALADEVHAHKTREVWDVLNVARGSRANSMQLGITTAGENKHGVCYEQHTYVEQILQDRHVDDRYFGIIYTIDESDDWVTEASARKANPNYGVSVLPDDIETLCRQAQSSAESQNTFLMKRLNVWTNVGTAYFNMLAWDRICVDPSLQLEDFYGQTCVVTLDLASKSDLAAKIYLFQRGNGFIVFGRYYLPEDAIERGKPNYDFYRGWAAEGRLILTNGTRTDYTRIEDDILEDQKNFNLWKLGADPNYNAEHLTQRLTERDVPVEAVPQTVANFSEPMMTLASMIVAGQIKHNGDPVLSWALGNVVAKKDVKGNVYPRKTRDENKIDPAVALIGNMSIQLRNIDDEGSMYDNPQTAVM